MLGLRPWLAFFLRALCFFFWVRLDMHRTLPAPTSPTPTGSNRYAAAIRHGPGAPGGASVAIDEAAAGPDRGDGTGPRGGLRSPGPLEVVLAGLLAGALEGVDERHGRHRGTGSGVRHHHGCVEGHR